MNTLDYVKEKGTLQLNKDSEPKEYNCYYYVVDGKKLTFEESDLGPITCFEVLEKTSNFFDKDNYAIILSRCSCGEWECDSVIANVFENEATVIWKLYSIHNDNDLIAEYEFDSQQHYEVMKSITEDAKEEIFDENFSKNKLTYLFYWKNGETHPELFEQETYHEEIKKYWKYQAETNNNEPEYFEDVRNNDYYRIKNGKWEEVAELNWPPHPYIQL